MQYFDEQAGAGLREAFDDLVGGWEEEVSTVTMFGCPSYRANGKVFAVLTTDAVALTRLPEDVRADLEAERETEPFDANGRAVRKWVQVPTDGTDLGEIERYVRASYEAAAVGSGGK
jgi:hypothetical protein